MCFSQYTSYSKRPVKKSVDYKNKLSKMKMDGNFFGPTESIYADTMRNDSEEHHFHIEENEVSKSAHGTIVKLSNGKKNNG